jgi:hypothetical protein
MPISIAAVLTLVREAAIFALAALVMLVRFLTDVPIFLTGPVK